jgi:hypothetical protein
MLSSSNIFHVCDLRFARQWAYIYYDLIHYVALKPGIEQVVQTFGTTYQTSRCLNQ